MRTPDNVLFENVTLLSSSINYTSPQVNVLWDLGPHDVSIFQYCMKGEMPNKVTMTGQNVMSPNGLLDVAFLTLNYASGVIGQIHVSWVDPHKARDIAFVGTRARVVMNDMDPQESLRIFKTGFIVGVRWSIIIINQMSECFFTDR